jgi:hypothetical protein
MTARPSKHLEQRGMETERTDAKDCGCGFGRHCVTHQKHNVAPPEFDTQYRNAPRRYTLEEIRWMRKNPGEPPFIPRS